MRSELRVDVEAEKGWKGEDSEIGQPYSGMDTNSQLLNAGYFDFLFKLVEDPFVLFVRV